MQSRWQSREGETGGRPDKTEKRKGTEREGGGREANGNFLSNTRGLSCAGADIISFIIAMRFHNRKRAGRHLDLLVLLLDLITYSFLTPSSSPRCARGC